uniref:Phosphoglucomutase, cytoplasmic n=1 Tax=Cajanus cajan TaxID=3821 RepID=A0A151R021_CAJCA|nr:Phosphoglucomutase, cytoplasmic [Cajanus cajan]
MFSQVDITKTGITNFTGPEGPFDVEVFDSTSDYTKLMKRLFYNFILRSAFMQRRGHLDPNLTYRKEFVAPLGLGKSDRNMILGKRSFVTPSDSVVITAANAVEGIPYFSAGLKGVARFSSYFSTLKLFSLNFISSVEVPTGWKFFGNLMDVGFVRSGVKKVLGLVRVCFCIKRSKLQL